jgi:predicted lipid carrier protein YhbT
MPFFFGDSTMALKHFSLPAPFAYPLKFIPESFHSNVVVIGLNRILSSVMSNGDLDFLEQRVVLIRLTDAPISIRVKMAMGRIIPCNKAVHPDVVISSSFQDFLILTARKEDSDTLFFQRRLCIEGDTELGLQLKNTLDAVEMDDLSVPMPMKHILNRVSSVIDRLSV